MLGDIVVSDRHFESNRLSGPVFFTNLGGEDSSVSKPQTHTLVRCGSEPQLRLLLQQLEGIHALVFTAKFAADLIESADARPLQKTPIVVDPCLDEFIGWAKIETPSDLNDLTVDHSHIKYFGHSSKFSTGKGITVESLNNDETLRQNVVSEALDLARNITSAVGNASTREIIPPWVSPRGDGSQTFELNYRLYALTVSQLQREERAVPVLPVTRTDLARRRHLLGRRLERYRKLGPSEIFVQFQGLAEHLAPFDHLFLQDTFLSQVRSEIGKVGILFGGAYSRIRTSGLIDSVCGGAGRLEHYVSYGLGRGGQPQPRFYIPLLRTYFDYTTARSLLLEFDELRCTCVACSVISSNTAISSIGQRWTPELNTTHSLSNMVSEVNLSVEMGPKKLHAQLEGAARYFGRKIPDQSARLRIYATALAEIAKIRR